MKDNRTEFIKKDMQKYMEENHVKPIEILYAVALLDRENEQQVRGGFRA